MNSPLSKIGDFFRRRKNIRGVFYYPLMFLFFSAVLIFSISIFFRVSKIEVIGNERYSDQEVTIASGIEEGENLLFMNRFRAVSRIFARLPYVESVSVSRKLPNRSVIEIKESIPIAYVTIEGQEWIIGRNSKVLSQAKKEDLKNLINVIGVSPIDPTIGEMMKVDDADKDKVQFLCDILNQIQERNLMSDVSNLDLTNEENVSFTYLDRFFVQVGNNTDLISKFGKMISAVAKLTPGDMGALDLSPSGNDVYFRPE